MADDRRRLEAERLSVFMRAYGRKKRRNCDPNDRGYDRKLADRLRRMDPADLDALLHGDADESAEGD